MSSVALFRQRHSRGAALAALCAILFLTFLDNTIVSVALADIQSSLSASVSGLQWIVDGYMLAFAALMLTGGTLGDLFGRKKVMLAGVVIFCAGSVVAAVAPTSGILIAGRLVMGVGAAASEPGTLSLIRHIYPERAERARALGVWAAVSGLALALGPVIGGVLADGPGWRSIFWFGLGFGALALAVAAVTLTESKDPEGRKLDVPGLVTGACAITAATFAVIGGENRGYGTWWIDGLFVLAAVLVVAFVLIERRSPDPVAEARVLPQPDLHGGERRRLRHEPLGLLGLLLHRALPAADLELHGEPDRARLHLARGGDDRGRPRRRPLDRAGGAEGADGGRLRARRARAPARRSAAHGDDEHLVRSPGRSRSQGSASGSRSSR